MTTRREFLFSTAALSAACVADRDPCWRRMFPDLCGAGSRPNTAPVRRSGAPGSLVFMHWNIGHFCHGRSCSTAIGAAESNEKAGAFRAFFEKYSPDVAGLCEYSAEFDVAGGKARTLPFADFASLDEGPCHEYQCNAMAARRGVLSRLDLRYYAKHRQKTYYLAEEVEVNGVKSVFVETHLDAYRDQIRELVDRFRRVPRIVIAGDFNVPDVSWYEPFLSDGYAAANCAGFGTIPTHKSHSLAQADAIDNVFVRGWTIEDVAVGDYELALSDHRALVCALTPKG